MNLQNVRAVVSPCLLLFPVGSPSVPGQGTAFTYQGRLNDGGPPAKGTYDFAFTLFGACSGGNALAATQGLNQKPEQKKMEMTELKQKINRPNALWKL